MPLEFYNDAIVLSGETGTKLKSSILEEYYERWWKITSGGESRSHFFPTSIIEMNAATGEVYIKDTGEMLLGSAGHALQLKQRMNWKSRNLKVICIEENDECYLNLKEVIKRRWPHISLDISEGPPLANTSNVYLVHAGTDEAITRIGEIGGLGNSIFFYDPLLFVDWKIIDNVAKSRIDSYYKTGTEFIIFMFTSDWFLGRGDSAPLPITMNEDSWSEAERRTIMNVDQLFGHQIWRKYLLTDSTVESREGVLIDLYCFNLFTWFRYVLPLPFKPKKEQLYHLFFCSNYEAGINLTKRYYQWRTKNPLYSPDNKVAFSRFKRLHPDVFIGIRAPRRPLEWKMLWKIIKAHEFGICDPMCRDFIKDEPDLHARNAALDWLDTEEYLRELQINNPYWDDHHQKYILEWDTVRENLNIDQPIKLNPIEPVL